MLQKIKRKRKRRENVNRLACPGCGSSNTLLNGRSRSGEQNNKCADCGRQFLSKMVNAEIAKKQKIEPKIPLKARKRGRPRIDENPPLSPCHNAPSTRRGSFKTVSGEKRQRWACNVCHVSFVWPPPERDKPIISKASPKTSPKRATRTYKSGAESHTAKLSEAAVSMILELKASGLSGAAIAKEMNIPYPTVMGVLTGRTWSSYTGIQPGTSSKQLNLVIG